MVDILFQVRNLFFLGAYQAAINEGQDLQLVSDLDKVERDVFVYRSYIALGSPQLVISEVQDGNAAAALIAVKLLAEYKTGAKPKEECLTTMKSWMEDPVQSLNPTVCLIAGIIYSQEGDYVEALRACHTGTSLEMQALMVQVYLAINREDHAEKVVKAMSGRDDDSTITQLATAWLGLALGGAKVQEAAYIYQELGDKYQWTAPLHNGLAAANMKMLRWDEAEHELQDALKKNDKDPDVLSNMAVCLIHLHKPYNRILTQLRMAAPQHPMVVQWDESAGDFDRAAHAIAGQ